MPDVHADPDKLRAFTKELANASNQFEQLTRQMQRSLDRTDWRDSERQRFETDFNHTMKSLLSFSERLRSQYVPQLQRKAAALDQFRAS